MKYLAYILAATLCTTAVGQFIQSPPPAMIRPAQIPEELEDIIPPQVGWSTTNGFYLKMTVFSNGVNVVGWVPPDFLDVKVAVTNGATAGYLGEFKTNGVLRTDDTIDYSIEDAEAVLLSANASNIWTTIINNYQTNDILGDGTCNGQVLWWDANAGEWINSTCPTAPAVLVYDKVDSANGTVRWETIDTLYKGIFRDTNSNATADWPRFHAE